MKPVIPDAVQILWVKSVDGLATPQEQAELEAFLETQPELRKELQMDAEVKASTDALTQRILADAQLEPPRGAKGARWMISAGFVAVLLGALTVLGFAGYLVFSDPELPQVLRWGLASLAMGVCVLFLYELKVRIRASGRDPYEELDR